MQLRIHLAYHVNSILWKDCINGLAGLGIKGLHPDMINDELDAVTGGFTAYLYLKGKADILGSLKKGAIIIPKNTKSQK